MLFESFGSSLIVDILVLIGLFIFAKFILKIIAKKLIQLFQDENIQDTSRTEKRAETIGAVLIGIGNAIIYGIILIMLLGMIGVDIRPILAGIGILGLAIGFGAQSVVKDFISGLFIIIEDRYNVGDKIKIGAAEGNVIKLTMRSTVLRDEEGATYYVSNGSIKDVINYSKK